MERIAITKKAAIILQHVTTKLRQTEIDWHLTETEQQAKRFDWCKKTIKSYDDIINRYHQTH